MATFPAAVSAAANDARVDTFDTGTGTPTLVVYDSGFVTALITFNLDGTNAFGSSTAACPSVATATGLPISASAANTGTAAGVRGFDRDGTQVYESTDVGTSGNEVVLSSTSITSGQSFDLTSFTISQPCS